MRTYQYAATHRCPDIYVRDARVDVHTDGLAILQKDLLEEHVTGLASFHERIRHEVPFRSVRAIPAQTEAFLFRSPSLNEDKPCAGHLGLYSTSIGL